jgi:hypothetical protein
MERELHMTTQKPALPPYAQTLLASLRLVRDNVIRGLDDHTSDFPEEDDLEEDESDYFMEMSTQIPHCVKVLQTSLRKIEKSLEALNEEISQEPEQTNGVARATGKFEAAVDGLLEIYRKTGFWQRECYVDDETALFYLESICEHMLEEIRDWLEEFVSALEYPVNNQITFHAPLVLTDAPETELLGYWLDDNAPEKKAKEAASCSWGILCAFALGVYLG